LSNVKLYFLLNHWIVHVKSSAIYSFLCIGSVKYSSLQELNTLHWDQIVTASSQINEE